MLVDLLDTNLINKNSTVSETVKNISILDAIKMLVSSWDEVKQTTVCQQLDATLSGVDFDSPEIIKSLFIYLYI